ncbi:hypothetical protein ACFU6M_04740 [Streptomyces bottropensis]|uniref:8-oxoguanine DNA glycosylase OGG fold protein n=1 Tax=Streptomyces bottropensis TaxID=42235 RepID=UPI003675FB8E
MGERKARHTAWQRADHSAEDPGRRGLDAALALAVSTLDEHGSRQAYAVLHQGIPELGPSFFTKFLYCAGVTLPSAQGPRPLVLDRVLSLRMRSLAAAVGRETGHDPDGSVAAWVWAD